MGVVLSEWQADLVFDVLVDCCGVVDDPDGDTRHDFVHHASREGISEWRFVGALGMGGKIYGRHGWTKPGGAPGEPELWIDCYPEDLTDERRAMIEAAMVRLQELPRELQQVPTGPRQRLSPLAARTSSPPQQAAASDDSLGL